MDKNTNSNRLGAFEVSGMGNGLFAKEAFSIKDIVICVYHGMKITRQYAYAKMQLSQYIVEITDHFKLPLCIDRLDDRRNQCFSKGKYANDAID